MARCKIKLNDNRCPRTPVYRIWFTDCSACEVLGGFLFCAGHYACVDCTAELRTNGWEFSGEKGLTGDAEPCRVRSLA